MSYIGPLTQELLDLCIKEIKRKETREKISSYILDPIFSEVVNRYYYYAFVYIIIQILIVVLLLYIIFLLKNKSVG